MSILRKINLFFNFKFYGSDEFGNKYFIAKNTDPVLKIRKRVVEYNGLAEASKVPPTWHAWLHYLVEDVDGGIEDLYDWQKPHAPNLTGTKDSYLPRWHMNKGEAKKVSQDKIIAWEPK